MEDLKLKETELVKGEKTALVVIDLQNGIVNRELFTSYWWRSCSECYKISEGIKRKGGICSSCKSFNFRWKRHAKASYRLKNESRAIPTRMGYFIPELAEIKDAHVVTKRQWGAFYGTDLDLQLRRRGIDTIVLCGISTGIGVDTTAREAYQHGYNQIFVEDAMAAMSKEEHDYVCKHIFPRIGKIRSCEEVLLSLR